MNAKFRTVSNREVNIFDNLLIHFIKRRNKAFHGKNRKVNNFILI